MSIPSSTAIDVSPAGDPTPSFLIGQDGEGHWVAVEVHGLGGGLFRSREGAVHYARDESRGRAGAVRLVAEPLSEAVWASPRPLARFREGERQDDVGQPTPSRLAVAV